MLSMKPKLDRAGAMAVKPVKAVDVEMEDLPDGGGKLHVKVRPPRVARWLIGSTQLRDKTFEFDRFGRFVWDQIDGRTAVSTIIRRLSEQMQLNLRVAETSTVAFLKLLVRRGLVAMPVEKPVEKPRA